MFATIAGSKIMNSIYIKVRMLFIATIVVVEAPLSPHSSLRKMVVKANPNIESHLCSLGARWFQLDYCRFLSSLLCSNTQSTHLQLVRLVSSSKVAFYDANCWSWDIWSGDDVLIVSCQQDTKPSTLHNTIAYPQHADSTLPRRCVYLRSKCGCGCNCNSFGLWIRVPFVWRAAF
jgi:hypothetical protein